MLSIIQVNYKRKPSRAVLHHPLDGRRLKHLGSFFKWGLISPLAPRNWQKRDNIQPTVPSMGRDEDEKHKPKTQHCEASRARLETDQEHTETDQKRRG